MILFSWYTKARNLALFTFTDSVKAIDKIRTRLLSFFTVNNHWGLENDSEVHVTKNLWYNTKKIHSNYLDQFLLNKVGSIASLSDVEIPLISFAIYHVLKHALKHLIYHE